MRYWLTTHWPPYEDEHSSQCHIYLKDEHGSTGQNIRPGDQVLIFETQSGKAHRNAHARRKRGQRGIVAIGEVTTELQESGLRREDYDDGTSIHWHWHARTRSISDNGFVPWQEVNRVLGYSGNYNMRGFGG